MNVYDFHFWRSRRGGQGVFFDIKKGAKSFFVVQKGGENFFLEKKGGLRVFSERRKGGGEDFFYWSKIPKTRLGYLMNFDRSLNRFISSGLIPKMGLMTWAQIQQEARVCWVKFDTLIYFNDASSLWLRQWLVASRNSEKNSNFEVYPVL